jgi:hypothetical protein
MEVGSSGDSEHGNYLHANALVECIDGIFAIIFAVVAPLIINNNDLHIRMHQRNHARSHFLSSQLKPFSIMLLENHQKKSRTKLLN